jgi:hypothetical protein
MRICPEWTVKAWPPLQRPSRHQHGLVVDGQGQRGLFCHPGQRRIRGPRELAVGSATAKWATGHATDDVCALARTSQQSMIHPDTTPASNGMTT